MPKVFISYRTPDRDRAQQLYAELQARGHDPWLDDKVILPGGSIVGAIDSGLMESRYVILCLSEDGPSEWTDREWMSTLARQLMGLDVKLLPVLLSGGRLPAILADISYVDLTRDWQQGVDALCRAMR